MSMYKKLIKTTTALMLLSLTLSVNATVVYDELASGDAGLTPANGVSLGTLGAGSWEIINGSLDGGAFNTTGPDEFDDYYFTTTGAWTVDLTSLNLISTNSLLTFQLNSMGGGGGSLSFDSSTGTDVLGGPIAAGSYGIRVIPEQNTGQLEYAYAINVVGVPAPAVNLIFGLGLIVLGWKRKARTSV